MKNLVYGVGINDADYVIKPTINGKRVFCPYYRKWIDMLQRCYSEKYHKRQPTYIGCEVAEEWLTFSNFKAWMEGQDWKGKQLDKDILIPNNKLYSRDTCVFVDSKVNSFLSDCKAARGSYMVGVDCPPPRNKFRAQCNDGNGKLLHLGLFETELEAHLVWKACKRKLACKLAEEQSDARIAEALRNRFRQSAIS